MLEKQFYVLSSVLLAPAASAADLSPPVRPVTAVVYASPAFDISLSMGVMSARAKEILYATRGDGSGLPAGAKISQLDWRISGTATAGLSLGWNVVSGTRIESSLHVPVTRDTGSMTNTDWLNPDFYPAWTDRSQHPDTRLGRTFIADAKVVQRFFQSEGFSGHAMAGFRRTEMSWKAIGGTFIYTEASAEDCASYGSRPPVFDAGSDFRNCSGSFDDVPQITYRQKFNAPYLGLRGVYEIGAWTVSADLVGSPFVFSSDKDVHVGATVFTDDFRRQKMLGATMQMSYQFNSMLAFFVEADGQWYFTRKGTADATDLETGEYVNYGPGSAGISLRTAKISAGLKASF